MVACSLSLLFWFSQLSLAAIPSGLVGLWTFEDAENLGKASYGDDLMVIGAPPLHRGSLSDRAASSTTVNGVIITQQGAKNHLRATHAIGVEQHQRRITQYSLVFDLLLPSASGGNWHALYQTNLQNSDDAEYFIKAKDGKLGRSSNGVGYSDHPLARDRWQRIVISVDLAETKHFRTYLDAKLFHQHRCPPATGDYALFPGDLLFFADDDGENHPLVIGMVAIFDKSLSAQEIASLGRAGEPLIPAPQTAPHLPIAHAFTPPQPTTSDFVTLSLREEQNQQRPLQFQADWGNGNFSTWTAMGNSKNPHLLKYQWKKAGNYPVRVRARAPKGNLSAWQSIGQLNVTGPPIVTMLTPPYLQNLDIDRIVVMWETIEDLPVTLHFGQEKNLTHTVTSQRTPSGGDSFFHRAIITGLQPQTRYDYQIRLGEQKLSELNSFTTAPDQWVDFSFAALGDTQTTNGGVWDADPWEPTKSMLADMVERKVDFGLALGDLASDGDSYTSTQSSFLQRWASIFGPHRAFFNSWGNHDGKSPTHPLRLAMDLPSRWQAEESPSTRTPGYGNYWFTYSGVFFVCLEYFETHNRNADDPNNDLTNGWLDAALSSPAAKDARFRIVAIHFPPFCERWIDGNAKLREQLVPRLEKYKVDLCMSGHMHGYEQGQINGVRYVISGGGSYLDFKEVPVANWSHKTDEGKWLGGHHNVPGRYARQQKNGKLGRPEPIQGGLFHGYSLITIKDRSMRLDQHAFNADGSYIGILDSIEWTSSTDSFN